MDTQSNVTSTAELESQLDQIILSIEEVVPQRLRQWLTAFACSNGTTSEMLLCSALVSTSSLLGQTTLELFGSYEEKANLIWSLLPLLERGKHQRAIKDAWSQSWAMSRSKYRPALWLMKHHQAAYSTISWEVSFYLTLTGAPNIDYYLLSVVSFS